MPRPSIERRHFLQTCGVVATGSLAGCTFSDSQEPAEPIDNENPPDDRTESNELPETPPVAITSGRFNTTFDLFTAEEYLNTTWSRHDRNKVPDSEAIDVELTGTEATIDFTGVVTHPVTLALNLTSPAWENDQIEGRFYRDSDYYVETTLDADVNPDTKLSPDDHTRHRATIDVNHIDFPKNVNVDAHVVVEDHRLSQPGDRDRFYWVLAMHRAIPIHHNDGVRWINHSRLTPTSSTLGGSTNYLGHYDYHTQDDDGSTTRTFACIRNDHISMFGVAIETNNAEMQNYKPSGQSGHVHIYREVNAAPQKPAMRKLAQDLWDAHTAIGITDILDRLRATAKFAQSFPYAYANGEERKPLYCIHSHEANCSEKTALYGAILRCQQYDIRLADIYCDIIDVGAHAVGGIDMTHIQDSRYDLSNLYTVNPDDYPSYDGIPAGEYAFIDLTDRSNDIGEFDSDTYDIKAFWNTNRAEGDM